MLGFLDILILINVLAPLILDGSTVVVILMGEEVGITKVARCASNTPVSCTWSVDLYANDICMWFSPTILSNEILIAHSYTSHTKNFHSYGDVTLLMHLLKGSQILSFFSALTGFKKGGIFIVPLLP